MTHLNNQNKKLLEKTINQKAKLVQVYFFETSIIQSCISLDSVHLSTFYVARDAGKITNFINNENQDHVIQKCYLEDQRRNNVNNGIL